MSMLSILVKDAEGVCIPVLTEESLEDIIKNLTVQKGWDIVEVTNNSGSFCYPVKDGIVYKDGLPNN
jgi:hypothetical protein